EVYEAAKQVGGLARRANIMRLQADSGQMTITQLFVLQNNSKPPRTQMSEHSFEFMLPEGAIVDSSLAAGPGGMPVNSPPVPTGEKNRYGFVFPIRPGETKFQVSYHLPYSGSFSFKPEVFTPMEDVVVMLPKSMQFNAASSDFASSGEEKGMNIFVAHNFPLRKQLAFAITGTGQIPPDAQDNEAAEGQDQVEAQRIIVPAAGWDVPRRNLILYMPNAGGLS